MNIEQARDNMLHRQIRTWNVLDPQLLNLLTAMPREKFVPAAYQSLAFADTPIPVNAKQTMLPPKEEARIVQALVARPTDKALVLGTGSGYLTALLAKQCQHVYSLDVETETNDHAAKVLNELNIQNVTLITSGLIAGYPKEAPYDIILLTGSVPHLPPSIKQSLAIGGRLFFIIGTAPVMEATLMTRVDEQNWQVEKLFETVKERLPGFVEPTKFSF